MADIDEIKTLIDEGNKTLHDLRAEVKAKANSADVVDQETLKKAREEFAEQISKEEKARVDLEAKMAEMQVKLDTPSGGFDGKDNEVEKKFSEYLKGHVSADEFKAMATNSAVDGGFLIMPTMLAGIQDRLRRTSPVRSVATVYQAGTLELLVERGDAGYEWTGETTARSETDSPTIHRVGIPTHELSALPKISQRMLDEAGFDIGAWLVASVADRFSRAEASAFVSGTGVGQPKGFLEYSTSTAADSTRADQTLQIKGTGASGAFNSTSPANILVTTFYELQSAYQNAATWLMKNTTMAAVATLEDTQGAYLLQSMLNTDGSLVRTIMGRPALLADDMPAIAGNSLSIAVGDFSKYAVVDNGGVTTLRDPYSSKPHVQFYTTKRVGGGVTDFDAIKLIKFG